MNESESVECNLNELKIASCDVAYLHICHGVHSGFLTKINQNF